MQSEEKPQDETVAPEAAEDSAVNDANDCAAVSYTHLTLPTIYSV